MIGNVIKNSRILEEEFFGCLPCNEKASLKFKTKELLEKLLGYTGHCYSVVRM